MRKTTHHTQVTRGPTPCTFQAKVRHTKQTANFLTKQTQNILTKNDHKGQHNSVSRPAQIKQTEEPQEHKHHEEILSIQIDDTQKSTYNAKIGSTEATALFDSGATLSCISTRFYNHICHIEPSMVIDTNTGPAIIITSASADKTF